MTAGLSTSAQYVLERLGTLSPSIAAGLNMQESHAYQDAIDELIERGFAEDVIDGFYTLTSAGWAILQRNEP